MAARERWSRIIEEQRASGLSVARFCEGRRIPASSFFPWRKRLEAAPAAPAFVEAKVRGGTHEHGGGVAIELSRGLRVIVGHGFDRDLLLEVIAALGPAAGGPAGGSL
jgi:hypothetical protein